MSLFSVPLELHIPGDSKEEALAAAVTLVRGIHSPDFSFFVATDDPDDVDEVG